MTVHRLTVDSHEAAQPGFVKHTQLLGNSKLQQDLLLLLRHWVDTPR